MEASTMMHKGGYLNCILIFLDDRVKVAAFTMN